MIINTNGTTYMYFLHGTLTTGQIVSNAFDFPAKMLNVLLSVEDIVLRMKSVLGLSFLVQPTARTRFENE